MASSINTNSGAAIALQSLQMTQRSLQETQSRISTGLKVGSAKDNAATWTVATVIRTDIANYKQVSQNLSTGSSIVGTAQAGAEQIAGLISQIKAKVTSAQDPANASNTAQIQADIDALTNQIDNTVKSSSFNGVNLLDGTLASQDFLSSVDKVGGASTENYISVTGYDLSTGAGVLSTLAGTDISDAVGTPGQANYATALAALDQAMTDVTEAAAVFGTAATQLETQKTFVDKLTDTLTTGVGALVDADMSQEAARLQALQVQQQLGTQALSIANQAPQSILSLFK
jgi:flagellin